MNTHLSRRSRVGLGLLALCISGLGTGCQTAKEAYSFQPIPHSAAVVVQPAEVEHVQKLNQAAPATAEQVVPASRAVRQLKGRRPLAFRPPSQPVASRSTPRAAVVALRQQFRQRRQSPQAPAEQGLGLTVLGLLGMVAVVVGLVGVVVGGGAAWAIIAGVGAVAVLLAYLIPRAQE